jgi:hypothetical protein
MRDWSDQPEAAGPQSETQDFGTAVFSTPGWRIGRICPPGAYPEQVDPARAAIEHTIAAERAADLLKVAPADALDLTAQPVTQDQPRRRAHRRTQPAEPEPGSTPEDAA